MDEEEDRRRVLNRTRLSRHKKNNIDLFPVAVMLTVLVLMFIFWNFFPQADRVLYILISIAVFLLILIAYFYEKREQQLELERQQRILSSGIYEIDSMQGKEFEEFLKLLFDDLGYKARVTKASGDYGADLVLNKDGKTIVVQAKKE